MVRLECKECDCKRMLFFQHFLSSPRHHSVLLQQFSKCLCQSHYIVRSKII